MMAKLTYTLIYVYIVRASHLDHLLDGMDMSWDRMMGGYSMINGIKMNRKSILLEVEES